jgi:hypothetical protein
MTSEAPPQTDQAWIAARNLDSRDSFPMDSGVDLAFTWSLQIPKRRRRFASRRSPSAGAFYFDPIKVGA